ncbi:putative ribonuclease H-like domain-containing protein [Tanacetum coccineum]|uniref:Ribonuclease H-like domain-containing protein n=1 Tax=Tanacetum coccineum TaxID=301880 RepID=A0ABQ4Y3J2_9ASTR
MRPFGCPVTILNTLDHLGTKENTDAGQDGKKIVPDQKYILLPLLTSDPSLSKSLKDSPDVGFKPSGEEEKIDSEHQENEDSEVPNTEDNLNYRRFGLWLIYHMARGPLVLNGCTETRKMIEMDVKSAVLYGTIEEEVYVCQPLGFEDPQFPVKVYKVEKALYGLHQAPRAWYETLSTYLLENGFRRGTIDKTLFIKKDKGDILLVQVYVDDIIFGSTKKSLCVEFEQMMHKRFQMSSMGELTFFLGLQVKQKDDGIFISQDKYVADILKKFDFATVKTTSTPIETNKALLKDEEAEDVALI